MSCQHLISHLEFSIQYSINTFEYMGPCAVYFHCNRAKQNVFVNCFFESLGGEFVLPAHVSFFEEMAFLVENQG